MQFIAFYAMILYEIPFKQIKILIQDTVFYNGFITYFI